MICTAVLYEDLGIRVLVHDIEMARVSVYFTYVYMCVCIDRRGGKWDNNTRVSEYDDQHPRKQSRSTQIT